VPEVVRVGEFHAHLVYIQLLEMVNGAEHTLLKLAFHGESGWVCQFHRLWSSAVKRDAANSGWVMKA
jgi:hypothetical protein